MSPTYMQRHTMTDTVNAALERSVKYGGWVGGEGGLDRVYLATTLALSSAVVYTSHLFSPSEGVFFLLISATSSKT